MKNIDNVIQKRKNELLEKINDKKLILYVTEHAPTILFEAAGVDYLSWDWFLTLFGVSDAYKNKNVPSIYFPNDWCIYSRANFALEIKEPKPKVDLVVNVYTCDPITKMWEYLEKDYRLFYFNLPRSINDLGIDYWTKTTYELKKEIEEITGNFITDKMLQKAIEQEIVIRNKLIKLRKASFYKKNPEIKPSQLLKIAFLKNCLNQQDFMQLLNEAEKILGDIPAENEDDRPAFYLMGPVFSEPSPKILWNNVIDGVDILEKIEEMGFKTLEDKWSLYYNDSINPPNINGNPLKFVAEDSYLRPKHPCISPNETRIEEHQQFFSDFNLKGTIFYNYIGCRLYLMESRLVQYMFETEGKVCKHLQISGQDIDLENLLEETETFILSNS